MSSSLETRNPCVEWRIVDLARALPRSALIGGWTGKRILCEAVYRHVPKNLVYWSKQCFPFPLDRQWLRRESRDWAKALIDVDRLEATGLLAARIPRIWDVHHAGTENNLPGFWTILMIQVWLADQSVASPAEGLRAVLGA